MVDMKIVRENDPELYEALELELGRQRGNLELIASENFVSPTVMAVAGNFLTNKYAEGYPGKRYYGGCMYVDMAENLARERAKKLFGCDHVNVQPHCGANANLAVYFAACKPRGYHPRHESLARRTSDARQPGQHVRQILQFRSLRRFRKGRDH